MSRRVTSQGRMSGLSHFEMSGYPSVSQRRPPISQSLRRLASQHLRWLTAFGFFLSLLSLWSVIAKYRHPKERQPSPAFFGPHNSLVEDAGHGFLTLREARNVCQRRRWEPYATRDRRRKVYDLFLINTELDFLEIRLHELDSEVDYFVILESGTSSPTKDFCPCHESLRPRLRCPSVFSWYGCR